MKTLKEFTDKVISILGDKPEKVKSLEDGSKYFTFVQVKHSGDIYLNKSWVTGGMSGGNCWGDEPSYSRSAEQEPKFTELTKILLSIVPNIGVLQYEALIDAVVKYGEYSEHEYYGNSTNWSYKSIRLEDLYSYLCKESLL